MELRQWLVAVAGVGLLASAPVEAGATTRARTTVKANKVRHTPRRVVRRPARITVVQPVYPPPIVSGPIYAAPPRYAPTPSDAEYRWLDDADAMLGAIAGSPPDVAFAIDRDARFAWIFNDGGTVIAEPLNRFERRWYFFERDVTVPFLVRDVGRSFAFDRGRLAAVYDANGALRDGRRDEREDADAATLLDRGRRLWFAARDPRPLPPRDQLSGWSIGFDFGNDWRGEWGGNRGGWRADDRHASDDRYRREREDRRARGNGGDGRAGAGTRYWPTRSADSAPRPDADARRPRSADRAAPAAGQPPRAAYRPEPAAPPVPDRPGGFARRSTDGESGRAERRDDRSVADAPPPERGRRRDDPAVATAPPPAPEAAPPPERMRRREVEAEAAPPRAAPPVAAPEAAPPPRREREPVAAAPERVAPPPERAEPVAPPPPPPEPATPPERPKEHTRGDERPE